MEEFVLLVKKFIESFLLLTVVSKKELEGIGSDDIQTDLWSFFVVDGEKIVGKYEAYEDYYGRGGRKQKKLMRLTREGIKSIDPIFVLEKKK